MKYVIIGLSLIFSACSIQPSQVNVSTTSYKPVDNFDNWLKSEIEHDKMRNLKQRISQ